MGGAANTSCWNQEGAMYATTGQPVAGIAAMWMLVPIGGGLFAWIIDWLVASVEVRGFSPALRTVSDDGPREMPEHVASSAHRSRSVGAAKARNPSAAAPLISNKVW
jgi:hypothetical protein